MKIESIILSGISNIEFESVVDGPDAIHITAPSKISIFMDDNTPIIEQWMKQVHSRPIEQGLPGCIVINSNGELNCG